MIVSGGQQGSQSSIYMYMGFPGGSDGKESACNAGDLGLIPGLGRFPGGGHGSPLQYSCLENPHGQRSLAGYSPWGGKELDTVEQLSTYVIYTSFLPQILLPSRLPHNTEDSSLCCIQWVLVGYPF